VISAFVLSCVIGFLRSPVSGWQRRVLRIPCGQLVPLDDFD
jgi:hypothetical protein